MVFVFSTSLASQPSLWAVRGVAVSLRVWPAMATETSCPLLGLLPESYPCSLVRLGPVIWAVQLLSLKLLK